MDALTLLARSPTKWLTVRKSTRQLQQLLSMGQIWVRN